MTDETVSDTFSFLANTVPRHPAIVGHELKGRRYSVSRGLVTNEPDESLWKLNRLVLYLGTSNLKLIKLNAGCEDIHNPRKIEVLNRVGLDCLIDFFDLCRLNNFPTNFGAFVWRRILTGLLLSSVRIGRCVRSCAGSPHCRKNCVHQTFNLIGRRPYRIRVTVGLPCSLDKKWREGKNVSSIVDDNEGNSEPVRVSDGYARFPAHIKRID